MSILALRLGCIAPISTGGFRLDAGNYVLSPHTFTTVTRELVQRNAQKEFPNLRILEEPRAEPFAPGRPTLALLGGGDKEEWMMAVHGQRLFSDVNWLFVPNIPGNTFIHGGKVYVHGAVGFDVSASGRTSARVMRFSRPASVDRLASMDCIPDEIETRFAEIGSPINCSPRLMDRLSDKVASHAVFERAGIKSPRYITLEKKEYASLEAIEAALRDFLSENEIFHYAVKPPAFAHGYGVEMFSGVLELERAARHAHALFSVSEQILIEERIKSFPFYKGGKRYDWNFRIVIPLGDLENWNLHDTSEVRWKPFDFNPVNKSRGSNVSELVEIFDGIGFSQAQRRHIVQGLYRMSYAIREAALAISDKGIDGETKLGLDVILDESLNLYCIESNLGNVGGIGTLLSMRRGGKKARTVEALVRNLAASAKKNHRTASAASADTEREYLEGSWAWYGYVDALTRTRQDEKTANVINELEVASDSDPNAVWWLRKSIILLRLGRYDEALAFQERALAIEPNWEEAWARKGGSLMKLRRYDEAFAAVIKSIMIKPLFLTGWVGFMALWGPAIGLLCVKGLLGLGALVKRAFMNWPGRFFRRKRARP